MKNDYSEKGADMLSITAQDRISTEITREKAKWRGDAGVGGGGGVRGNLKNIWCRCTASGP